MNTIDLYPIHKSRVKLDPAGALFNYYSALDSNIKHDPPYDIEMLEENQYAITLAVPGFSKEELDIQVEKGVVSILGNKVSEDDSRYLHRGIPRQPFERKFHLAEYVEVTKADLSNGMLRIRLKRELPDSMKPKSIPIREEGEIIEHSTDRK